MQFFMFQMRIILGIHCSIMTFIMIDCLANLRSQLHITTGDCVLILALYINVNNEI